MALSLSKSSHWTFSQASAPPWSFITAMEECLEAMKDLGQPSSWANPQALEFSKCHSLSAAKALLIKNVEFIVH